MAWRVEGLFAYHRDWAVVDVAPRHSVWVARHTSQSSDEASPNVWFRWSQGRGGSSPRTFSQGAKCSMGTQDARCCSTSDNDNEAPLVHSRVQGSTRLCFCTKVTNRRRRQLRALPWFWSETQSNADPSKVAVSSNVAPEVLDAMTQSEHPWVVANLGG